MAKKSLSQMANTATEIKDASTNNENTAQKVGQLLYDIIGWLGDDGSNSGGINSINITGSNGLWVPNQTLGRDYSCTIGINTENYHLPTNTEVARWEAAAQASAVTTWWGQSASGSSVTGNLAGNIGSITFNDSVVLSKTSADDKPLLDVSKVGSNVYMRAYGFIANRTPDTGSLGDYVLLADGGIINKSELGGGTTPSGNITVNSIQFGSSGPTLTPDNGKIKTSYNPTGYVENLGALLHSLNNSGLNANPDGSNNTIVWDGSKWIFGPIGSGGITDVKVNGTSVVNNNVANIPLAYLSNTIPYPGVIKVYSQDTSGTTHQYQTGTSGKDYPVRIDTDGIAYVNVPEGSGGGGGGAVNSVNAVNGSHLFVNPSIGSVQIGVSSDYAIPSNSDINKWNNLSNTNLPIQTESDKGKYLTVVQNGNTYGVAWKDLAVPITNDAIRDSVTEVVPGSIVFSEDTTSSYLYHSFRQLSIADTADRWINAQGFTTRRAITEGSTLVWQCPCANRGLIWQIPRFKDLDYNNNTSRDIGFPYYCVTTGTQMYLQKISTQTYYDTTATTLYTWYIYRWVDSNGFLCAISKHYTYFSTAPTGGKNGHQHRNETDPGLFVFISSTISSSKEVLLTYYHEDTTVIPWNKSVPNADNSIDFGQFNNDFLLFEDKDFENIFTYDYGYQNDTSGIRRYGNYKLISQVPVSGTPSTTGRIRETPVTVTCTFQRINYFGISGDATVVDAAFPPNISLVYTYTKAVYV